MGYTAVGHDVCMCITCTWPWHTYWTSDNNCCFKWTRNGYDTWR